MRVIRVTKTFYETEDGEKTYFAEPLGKNMVSRIRRNDEPEEQGE